jgi:hypothetical protein
MCPISFVKDVMVCSPRYIRETPVGTSAQMLLLINGHFSGHARSHRRRSHGVETIGRGHATFLGRATPSLLLGEELPH